MSSLGWRMLGKCSTKCHINMKVCDFVNVVGVLNACVNVVALEEGMCVHEKII
jgi:hypothetical protein